MICFNCLNLKIATINATWKVQLRPNMTRIRDDWSHTDEVIWSKLNAILIKSFCSELNKYKWSLLVKFEYNFKIIESFIYFLIIMIIIIIVILRILFQKKQILIIVIFIRKKLKTKSKPITSKFDKNFPLTNQKCHIYFGKLVCALTISAAYTSITFYFYSLVVHIILHD